MAKKYEANILMKALRGSCLKDCAKTSTLNLRRFQVKRLISEAWSCESIDKARSNIVGKNFDFAITCLDEAVKLSDMQRNSFLERAIVLYHKKHFLLALKDLDKLFEI